MVDLYHNIDNDLVVSPTGDLQGVDGLTLGTQRVLRRLLTPPGTYLWHPDYGGGLSAYVGRTLDAEALSAVIRNQLALEPAVAQDPAPVITMTPITDGVVVTIAYVDAVSKAPNSLTVTLNPS
jgi:hypothetical protein